MPGGQHPPLSIILSWPQKGTTAPASASARHGTVIWLCVLLALCVLVMAARMRARWLRGNYGWDDWLLLGSLVPTIGMVVVSSLGLEKYGFGQHIWDLDITTLIEARKVVFATEITFLWASSLIKLSILCFYTRLARDSMTSRYIAAVRMSMAFIVVYLAVFTMVLCLTCRPFSAFWTQIYKYMLPHKDFTCVDEGASLLWNTGISVVQDFLTTSLPFTLFWSLALPSRQKMALGAIFALGFLVCITGVMRFYYLFVMYYRTYDVTYIARDTLAWTTTELLVGTICASAPALKIYFRTLLPSHSTSSNQNNPSNQTSSNANQASPPALLSFHHSRHSRSMIHQQPSQSSIWRCKTKKNQDSFVRLDDCDGDEESVVGIARTTMKDESVPPKASDKIGGVITTITDVERSPEFAFEYINAFNSDENATTRSSQIPCSNSTTPKSQSQSSPTSLSSILYWPTHRSWSAERENRTKSAVSAIGSETETELSSIGSGSSPTSSMSSSSRSSSNNDKNGGELRIENREAM